MVNLGDIRDKSYSNLANDIKRNNAKNFLVEELHCTLLFGISLFRLRLKNLFL